MFKEDIKIKIFNEDHFNKVKEILVKECYFFSCGIRYPVDYLFVYNETQDVCWSADSDYFGEHKNKEYVLHNNTLIPKEQANKLLTPCEQLGYKVGDKFIVLKTTDGFIKGQTVNLYKDDGTSMPLFKGENTRHNHCNGAQGAWLNFDNVKHIKESNTKEENKMTEVNQQKAINKKPKNKTKTQPQLVFTYTNGKRYVVRGLQQVKVFLNGSKFQVDYTHATYDGVKHQTSNVSVYVTNELVKVEKINTDNSVGVILDLSSNSAKAQEVVGSPHEQSSRHSRKGPKKPRGNARSKEEYEAMLEAKKATSERNKAIVEAKAKELAATLLESKKSKNKK